MKAQKDFDSLTAIADFLTDQRFALPMVGGGRDGRVQSGHQEKDVLNKIKEQFKINVPQGRARAWYDFEYNGLYVNIKITDPEISAADNINSKEGLYLALTGDIYPGKNNWRNYFELLGKNIKRNDKDYYLLVIKKGDVKNNVFLTSLKRLQFLTPNGNNLPFQVNWSRNTKIVNRTFPAAKKFLLGTLYDSVKLRANILDEFKKNLYKYLE